MRLAHFGGLRPENCAIELESVFENHMILLLTFLCTYIMSCPRDTKFSDLNVYCRFEIDARSLACRSVLFVGGSCYFSSCSKQKQPITKYQRKIFFGKSPILQNSHQEKKINCKEKCKNNS